MSSNGLLGNYYGTLKEHLIGHVPKGQNGGSANMPLFGRDHECKECE